MYIRRVGTHDNIADLPSRDDLTLLLGQGAVPLEPVLRDRYWEQETRNVLQKRWRL